MKWTHFVLPLGYDPDEFFFSRRERERGREELALSADECVFITCTRVNAKKSLEESIDAISHLRADGHKIQYVIVGFLGDAYESKLKGYIRRQPEPHIFHCYPFLDHVETRRLYCSADVEIWLKAAISIQESMGTGLPVLLKAKPSVGHLVRDGINGWHIRDDDLVSTMKTAATTRLASREEIAARNSERLSYDRVTRDLIASVLPA